MGVLFFGGKLYTPRKVEVHARNSAAWPPSQLWGGSYWYSSLQVKRIPTCQESRIFQKDNAGFLSIAWQLLWHRQLVGWQYQSKPSSSLSTAVSTWRGSDFAHCWVVRECNKYQKRPIQLSRYTLWKQNKTTWSFHQSLPVTYDSCTACHICMLVTTCQRTFLRLACTLWNSLPSPAHLSLTSPVFCWRLKTSSSCRNFLSSYNLNFFFGLCSVH